MNIVDKTFEPRKENSERDILPGINCLPMEIEDDWFDVQPLNVDVKPNELVDFKPDDKPIHEEVLPFTSFPPAVEKDWFEINPAPRLILVKKCPDVVTIGSRYGGSYDIRGDIPNRKISVSPWLNSIIEPDTNIKPICDPNHKPI